MLMLVLVLVIAIGSALWLPLFAPNFELLVSATPFTIFDMIPLSRAASLAKMFGVASCRAVGRRTRTAKARSEEHTSELQSRFDLVCRLLLEKKKYIS